MQETSLSQLIFYVTNVNNTTNWHEQNDIKELRDSGPVHKKTIVNANASKRKLFCV